jgi:hypothetical protein
MFVGTTTILVLVGYATGSWRIGRFAWPGMHFGVAALFVGLTFIILVAAGRSFLGLRPADYALRLLLFGGALYLGETRSVLAGVLVGLGVLFLWSARTHRTKSFLGFTYYVIAIALLLLTAFPQITQYVLRGGTEQSLLSLSDRIPLWTVAIGALNEANRWLIGFGYGSARVVLPTAFSWAGTAHSSWMELLLSIGVAGPILAAADVLFVVSHAAGRRSVVPPAISLSILAVLIGASITGEAIALPGVGFTMLAFLHASALTQHNSVDHARRATPRSDHTAPRLFPRASPRGSSTHSGLDGS